MCNERFQKVIYHSRRESTPEKAGVTFCGMISFIFTTTLAAIFAIKWSKALSLGDEYYCTDFRAN